MKLSNSNRRGIVLIAVLVVLMVVLSIIGTAIISSLRSHRECRVDRQQVQIRLLCEAGMIRASEKRREDPMYQGEHWLPKMPADSDGKAELDIRILSIDSETQTIEIVASLSGGRYQHRMQRTRTFNLPTLSK